MVIFKSCCPFSWSGNDNKNSVHPKLQTKCLSPLQKNASICLPPGICTICVPASTLSVSLQEWLMAASCLTTQPLISAAHDNEWDQANGTASFLRGCMEGIEIWSHWVLFALLAVKVSKETEITPLLCNCIKLTRVFDCLNPNSIPIKKHLSQDRIISKFMSLGVKSNPGCSLTIFGRMKQEITHLLTVPQITQKERQMNSPSRDWGSLTASFEAKYHGMYPLTYTHGDPRKFVAGWLVFKEEFTVMCGLAFSGDAVIYFMGI